MASKLRGDSHRVHHSHSAHRAGKSSSDTERPSSSSGSSEDSSSTKKTSSAAKRGLASASSGKPQKSSSLKRAEVVKAKASASARRAERAQLDSTLKKTLEAKLEHNLQLALEKIQKRKPNLSPEMREGMAMTKAIFSTLDEVQEMIQDIALERMQVGTKKSTPLQPAPSASAAFHAASQSLSAPPRWDSRTFNPSDAVPPTLPPRSFSPPAASRQDEYSDIQFHPTPFSLSHSSVEPPGMFMSSSRDTTLPNHLASSPDAHDSRWELDRMPATSSRPPMSLLPPSLGFSEFSHSRFADPSFGFDNPHAPTSHYYPPSSHMQYPSSAFPSISSVASRSLGIDRDADLARQTERDDRRQQRQVRNDARFAKRLGKQDASSDEPNTTDGEKTHRKAAASRTSKPSKSLVKKGPVDEVADLDADGF